MFLDKLVSEFHGVPLVRHDTDIFAADSSSTVASSNAAPDSREYTLGEKFTPLKAHYRMTVNTSLLKQGTVDGHFATSQIAWSPDGTWMVSVGDAGMMCIFHRDKQVV